MGNPRVSAGGGFPAIYYTLKAAQKAGGWWTFYRRMRTKNACKTCALGMGGQHGGMVNEAKHFPEVCKKSAQAQAADMQPPISEDFFKTTPIAMLERFTSRQLENLGRLTFPIIAEAGDTHFRRIAWDEAQQRTHDGIRNTPPEQFFFYASGRSSNEAAFLAQLVIRAFGSPNIHNCSYYCHQASGVALKKVYGSGTASITLEDLSQTDLALVVGANPASNHPRLMTQLMELRRRGGRVIVINPVRELGLVRFRIPSDWRSLLFGSEISDLYLQPHIGSDIAVLKAMLKGVLERHGAESTFVREATTGFAEVATDVKNTSWDTLLERCGLDRESVDHAVEMVVSAKRGICMWAMGLTHHTHGVDNILALANLALARGWLGQKGAGLLPIRGHSNVQGVGSVGVTPTLKRSFAEALESVYDIAVPSRPGQDTFASMQAAEQGRIRSAFLLGGNLYGSNPDAAWAQRALRRIGLTAQVSTKLNTGHIHGRGRTSIVLPALGRDEEHQRTTQESMFNYVRVSEGGRPLVEGEMRSEVEIIAALARGILPEGKFDWNMLTSHARLRQAMGQCVPGYTSVAQVGEGGTASEFQIEGRTFHQPRFRTDDGKTRFHVTPLPQEHLPPGALRLMTLRSEGQFNTVVYEEEDLYRGATGRDVVLMAHEDAQRLGVEEDERVKVETEVGEMEVRVSLADIRPGNIAMYYPEANVLVPRRLDARSKTPAFKSVVAFVHPANHKRHPKPHIRAG